MSFLVSGLIHFWMPMAHAQFPDLLDSYNSNQQSSINYVKRGNIHIADIRIDGTPLFKVATAAFNVEQEDSRSILPIEWRVNEIETRLKRIIATGLNPDKLEVTVKNLNDQVVLVFEQENLQQPLMTVTRLDAQIDSTSNTVLEIARMRADKVKAALIKAHKERQPQFLLSRFYILLPLLCVTLIISLFVLKRQKLLKQKWQQLNQKSTEDISSQSTDTNIVENPQNDSSHLPEFSLTKQRSDNLTLRFILWWLQITVWLVVSIVGLLLFPQTRGYGIWLIGVPVNFIVILLGLSIAKKIIDNLIIYWLGQWAQRNASSDSPDQRLALRIPIINNVFREVVLYIVIGIGALLFLYAIKVPLTLLLILLGIVSFSIQTLIKDWIGGFLILWEDQYTQGDVVGINGISGVVEYFNLRITQLRNLDGELITIANGSFTTAINLTHQWSRLNLGIDVTYSTDLEKAIMLIEEVAQKMRDDLAWSDCFIEAPTVLGVDSFGENGIKIRLLIKTPPMKQWDLGREYRRRLKQAFDFADITIPIPQRSIWLESVSKDS